jgi:5-dehydro-4-deoxyglucarate dehydratase
MTMDPARLKSVVGSGLLAFPVTHFRADGAFDEDPYRASIAANIENEAVALFAPGGTGEFFSLTLDECRKVVRAAVAEAKGKLPIIAGVGYGTAMAVEFARAAEQEGADGILVLPQYLLTVEQEGLYRHIAAICRAVKIGVIVYNRDNCLFAAETLEKLAENHPNLIGFKDGEGDVEQLVRVRRRLGDRFVYVGGMPTAEVFAVPYLAAGFTTYSSAVFNFIPKTAQRFYKAVRSGDTKTTDTLLEKFFIPYIALRNRRRGYAVSIVKAGLRVVGKAAGPVRPPLTDLTDDETAELKRILVDALGDAIH